MIAKGSKSKLSYVVEGTFNTIPAIGAMTGVSLQSETFGEQINSVKSNEIRPDRTVPSIRGGNIMVAGNISNEFSPNRHGIFLSHLLGGTVVTAPISGPARVFVVDATANTFTLATHAVPIASSVIVGGSVLPTGFTANTIYYAGVVDANTLKLYDTAAHATTNDGSTGLIDPTTTGTAVTVAISVPPLAVATYVRGNYVYSNGRQYLCILGGAVSSVGGGLLSTSGDETIGAAVFEYFAAVGTPIYKNVITPGYLPSVGLFIEKQILGQTAAMYLGYSGCRIDSLDLTIAQEGIATSAWAMLAMASLVQTVAFSNAVSYIAEDPFKGSEAFIAFNGSQLCRPVKQGSMKITNNIENNIFVVGQRNRRELPENRREVSGSIETYFEDRTEYDFFKNETSVAVNVSFNNKGAYLSFDMGENRLTGSGSPTISGAGVLSASYTFETFRELGTTDITCTVYTLNNGLL